MKYLEEDQIAVWKQRHGAIYALEIGEYIAHVRKPSPTDLKLAHQASNGDPLKMHENLLDNCWLGGPPEVKTEDGLYLSAAFAMGELVAELLPEYEKRMHSRPTGKNR